MGWDTVMLSESMALSLMALLLAGWLWTGEGWSWRKLILLASVAFLWAFSRESNAWVLLTIAPVTFVAGIRRRSPRRYLFSLSCIFLCFTWLTRSLRTWDGVGCFRFRTF